MSVQESQRPTAGVIGAGVAGLAAAVALRRAGWVVEVFEKSRMKHEVGSAITVMPFAVSALDRWGFDFHEAQGVPCQRMTILHAENLGMMFHDEFTNTKQQYGHDCLCFHRVDLHKGLLELANEASTEKKGSPVSIHLATEVLDVDCDTGSIRLASGKTLEKDLLIIADGAHTGLLPQITGQKDTTHRIGRSLYRILLDRAKVDARPGPKRFLTSTPNDVTGMCCCLDPIDNAFMITYPCRGGSVLNIAVVHDTKNSSSNDSNANQSWQTPSSVSEVLATTHNFHPDLKSLLELAETADIKIHHGMTRPPLESFVNGKVVVLGDAGHLMMPTHAAGASIAIESAAVLEILMNEVTASILPSIPAILDAAERTTRSTSKTHSEKYPKDSQGNVTISDATAKAPPVNPEPVTQARPSISALVSRSLKSFDSLRVPRCTAFQILSNGGFMSQAKPEIVEQIRKHGFVGPVPGPTAGPFSEEYRGWYFDHDAQNAAKEEVRNWQSKADTC